ncbi:MAG TPA: hypothetical protein VFS43_33115 [Polyangiaceae bacterium]|nr:hypothetical protein [Polyangiaceae bacterium]
MPLPLVDPLTPPERPARPGEAGVAYPAGLGEGGAPPARLGEGGAPPARLGEGGAPPARLGAAGLWGVVGVGATFVQAITKLAPVAAEALRGAGLGAGHVAFLAAWVAFCAYVEGYRAFQRQFCPRAVARAQRLGPGSPPLLVALAPLYCMGLLHATRRRLVASWGVVFGVTGLVLVVRALPQPWRGLVDAGVLVALAWGVLCLGHFTRRALVGDRLPVSPDLPEP